MRYTRSVRREVRQELIDHFTDALAEIETEQQKQDRAAELIAEFGDAKLLAALIRRGKKRCRPLWKKTIIRTCQTAAVSVILFCFYTGWFVTGKPTISIDYLAKWNQMTKPTAHETDNGWPYYEKAIELYVEPDPTIEEITRNTDTDITALTDAERENITAWLTQNAPAWDQCIAGSLKPYCWKKYEFASEDDDWLLNILMPNLRSLRDLARLGIWRSRLAVERDQPEEALTDCITVARMGRHWNKPQGGLIEQLVGSAISSMAYGQILHILATGQISGMKLAEIQGYLQEIYPQSYPLMNVESQRLWFLDTVQHVFTKGGPGGGHILPNEMCILLEENNEFDDKLLATALGMVHARREATLAKANEIYNLWAEIIKMTPYQIHLNDVCTDPVSTLPEYRYFLIRYLSPALGRAATLGYRGKAVHEATLTILALQRWQLDKGAYPERLQELIDAAYLQQLPDDPYSADILKYERYADDFLLYSIAADSEDNGGIQHSEDFWGETDEGGDAVFWPTNH